MHKETGTRSDRGTIEWLTLGLIAATYLGWAWATTSLAASALPLAMGLLTLALVLHSSLTHEVVHGHPTPWQGLNAALMRPALGLVIPYGRFRDAHLAHHQDENLTDPYDDPESNYMDPAVWARLPRPLQALLRLNNTLAGRLALGPAISTIAFVAGDIRAIRAGDRRIARSWAAQGVALLPVGLWLAFVAQIPVWAYLVACYLAMSVLRLRTFLEHRAHDRARARTVIIEDRGLFAFLFLNNNFHVVHHMHPKVAWYKLPAQYLANKAHYLRRNDGYVYANYGQVIRTYLTRAKDPVPHPLWPQAQPQTLSQSPLEPIDAVLRPLPMAPQPVVNKDD